MTTVEIILLVAVLYIGLVFTKVFIDKFREFQKKEKIKRIEKIRKNAY